MVASDSNDSIRNGIRRLLRNEWFMAVAILVTAMAVRWEFHLWNPHPTGFFIYHGSPISDGSSYTFKAINIAKGYGIPPTQQPAIRPFYSIVLACLYTWTGFSLGAISALNIVIGGATAALIYLCGALVFNRLCAFGAALFFAIDPTQLIQTPQAGTEPLGLLFFVGSVYAALLAFKNGRAAMFFLSGLLIGLSNLTRTLTVFTLPFHVALILLVGWRKRTPKAAGIRAFLLLFGFFSVMLPWLIRQERLYGIVSLSDNIGEAIYAATSPLYKRWTPAVRKDADAAGIPNTIRDRYRYFIDRSVENVKTNPRFYLRNVGAALWEYANTFGPRSRAANRYQDWFSSAAQGQRVLLLYFLAAIWFPAESLSRRLAGEPQQGSAAGTEDDEPSSFQSALSLISRRSCLLLVIATLGFFLVSGARLIALSASNQRRKSKRQSVLEWSLARCLTVPDKVGILQRLQYSPACIPQEDYRQLQIYQGGKLPPKFGDYIVELESFYYDYHIPPGETLPYRMLGPKPYARTLVRLARLEFFFAGDIPAALADQPLVFIGVVVPQEVEDRDQALRPLVKGLAIVPLGGNGQPDFAHAVCAPPASEFTR